MRAPRFVHVGIWPIPPELDPRLIDQAVESEAWDWVRYSFFHYLLWTPSDTETVCRKILRVPGLERSNVLVCALDMADGFGSLPGFIWEWIRKDRGYGQVQMWSPPDVKQPMLPD